MHETVITLSFCCWTPAQVTLAAKHRTRGSPVMEVWSVHRYFAVGLGIFRSLGYLVLFAWDTADQQVLELQQSSSRHERADATADLRSSTMGLVPYVRPHITGIDATYQLHVVVDVAEHVAQGADADHLAEPAVDADALICAAWHNSSTTTSSMAVHMSVLVKDCTVCWQSLGRCLTRLHRRLGSSPHSEH